jgi:carbon starvation protein
VASGLVTLGYGWLIYTGNITTVWSMFGIANQLLAALALALVTTWIVNRGRGRYAPITVIPMLFVMSTTLSAAAILVQEQFPAMIADGRAKIAAGQAAAGERLVLTGYLNTILTIFVVASVCTLVLWSVARWIGVWLGKGTAKTET